MQMRFTDTHTVFIFILVSFYRTFLRFPHRLTIPAYEIRSHFYKRECQRFLTLSESSYVSICIYYPAFSQLQSVGL